MKFKCVLLVDDDGAANFMNYRVIKKMDLAEHIETVYNGEKALNFIQHYASNNDDKAPELILLDIKMPVLDGQEFLEYFFRKKLSNLDAVKIVIVSSSSLDRDVNFSKKYPNLLHIEKPLTQEKLEKLLVKM